MISRNLHDDAGQGFFITFSCYKRRRILDEDPPKEIVLEVLSSQLFKQKGKCQGFVIMPDHVHAMVWFPEPNQLSGFMKQWKQRSSVKIKKNLREQRTAYLRKVNIADPIWQAGYYSFNVYTDRKFREKLDYMHTNPVKTGLAARPEEYFFSSARHYGMGLDVAVPISWPG